jgi:hypothetical protein
MGKPRIPTVSEPLAALLNRHVAIVDAALERSRAFLFGGEKRRRVPTASKMPAENSLRI